MDDGLATVGAGRADDVDEVVFDCYLEFREDGFDEGRGFDT